MAPLPARYLPLIGVAAACQPASDRPPASDRAPDAGDVASLPPPSVIAATPTGLARIDARTGKLLQAWGTRPVVDVALDPLRGELASFEVDPREEGGWVVVHARSSAETARWFVDGDVRLVPAAGGLLSLERAYGERWRLLRTTPSSSWPAPRPSSLVLGEGRRVAFALTDDGAVLRTVALGPPITELRRLELAPPLDPTAQLLDPGHALDVVDGTLAVQALEDGRAHLAHRTAVLGGPLLAARRDGARIVALLAAPLRLVLLDGDRATTLPLPGEPCGGAIECRALVVTTPYAAVGTRDALHLVRMSADLRLVLEASTVDAHGPVAESWPEP